jgi:hypothetical protein
MYSLLVGTVCCKLLVSMTTSLQVVCLLSCLHIFHVLGISQSLIHFPHFTLWISTQCVNFNRVVSVSYCLPFVSAVFLFLMCANFLLCLWLHLWAHCSFRSECLEYSCLNVCLKGFNIGFRKILFIWHCLLMIVLFCFTLPIKWIVFLSVGWCCQDAFLVWYFKVLYKLV